MSSPNVSSNPATGNAATSSHPALVLRDVRKVYRSGEEEVVALGDADLTVASDEIVALVGPSGSGKTTLLSIAGGLLSPSAGSVVVRGEDISGYNQKKLTAFRGPTSASCSKR